VLAADILANLPKFQAEAESMMVTPCLVRRPVGVTADPVTGADVPVYEAGSVYQGGCKLQSREGEVRSAEVGSSTSASVRWEIHVPVSAGPFQPGDVVEVLGRVFRVESPHVKSWQTAQRLPVSEVL